MFNYLLLLPFMGLNVQAGLNMSLLWPVGAEHWLLISLQNDF